MTAIKLGVTETDQQRLDRLVRDSITKLGTTDFERVRSEVVLTHKQPASRKEIKQAIANAGPMHDTAAGKRTAPSKMTDMEKLQLMTWLNSHRDAVRDQKMSAAMVVAEFGKSHPDVFCVEENVKSAAKNLGIDLYRRPKTKDERKQYVGQTAKLTERVDQLEAKVAEIVSKLGTLLD
jgi:hypothetical protein